MNEAVLWSIEEGLWKGGEDTYRATLDPDCVMAFPEPAGILKGDAIFESIRVAPRWTSAHLKERASSHPRDDIAVLAYVAEAMRDGAKPYAAICCSTYVANEGVWRLVQHQQTPL